MTGGRDLSQQQTAQLKYEPNVYLIVNQAASAVTGLAKFSGIEKDSGHI